MKNTIKHVKYIFFANILWTHLSLSCVCVSSVFVIYEELFICQSGKPDQLVSLAADHLETNSGKRFVSVYSCPTSFWSITDYNATYWSENIIFLPVFVLCWSCVLWDRAPTVPGHQKTLLIRKVTERPVNSSSIILCVHCVCVCVCVMSRLPFESTFSRLKVSECFLSRDVHFWHQTFISSNPWNLWHQLTCSRTISSCVLTDLQHTNHVRRINTHWLNGFKVNFENLGKIISIYFHSVSWVSPTTLYRVCEIPE